MTLGLTTEEPTFSEMSLIILPSVVHGEDMGKMKEKTKPLYLQCVSEESNRFKFHFYKMPKS